MNHQPITLSEKDQEILKYRRRGFPLKLIASFVYLSLPGVKYRLKELRAKVGAKNDNELINYCHENGLFTERAA